MEELNAFPSREEGIEQIINKLPRIFPFNQAPKVDETDPNNPVKLRLMAKFNDLQRSKDRDELDGITNQLIDIIDDLSLINLRAADKVVNLLIQWEYDTPTSWYEKGKIMFQLFLNHKYHDLDEIVSIFHKVIEMGTGNDQYKILPYWSYVFLGNINLYRILEGEQALEQALKNYNEGYRYAKTYDVEIDESLIFDNVEIMQKILMNQFPLLLVIYNDTGQLLFEFLFQFIEVMNQDKRFIPNFTALLSAVDDHIQSLFKSHITNSYMVMKNRLLVITTLHEGETEDDWIKVAMVFSYLQQSAFEIDIDTIIMEKINEFVREVNKLDDIMEQFTKFNGRRFESTEEKVESILQKVFSTITEQ